VFYSSYVASNALAHASPKIERGGKMWAYQVWLKGRKDPVEVQLADNQMLLNWEAWQNGDTTKRVKATTAEGPAAVFNFQEVIGMYAEEIKPLPAAPGPFSSNPRPIAERARRFFGDRS
jgi:hypothetical protein